jgi:hypothetical protein
VQVEGLILWFPTDFHSRKNDTPVEACGYCCDEYLRQTYLFQQMQNLIFMYDKLGLHVSAYQAIIRAPITKNTENTASQNK